MATVDFVCSDTSIPNRGHVIVMCHCQLCSQLHAQVRGKVFSSFQREPVILAAVVVGSEIATFTDQDGSFWFETLTTSSELTLIFQETRHRELEKVIQVRPSLTHELTVVLQYIEHRDCIHKLEAGFDVALASESNTETYGIDGFLHFPPDAFTYSGTDTYRGAGNVLHSLYCTDKWPSFSEPALDHMVYVDSRGAEFSIQSLVIGSLTVVGDGGERLSLKVGAPIVVTVSLRFDTNVPSSHLNILHLFSHSPEKSRWLDHGKMSIVQDSSNEGEVRESNYWVTLQGKLRDLDPLWIVGYPQRLTCWVKTQVFHSTRSHEEIERVEINLRQSDDRIGRGSFYQHATRTRREVGACMKSVCSLGGILSPSADSGMDFAAVTPSIVNGIIMGRKDHIMIYTIEKQNIGINGRHPFYPSETACLQHRGARSGHFRFVTSSHGQVLTRPTIMLTQAAASQEEQERAHGAEFCYLKVAILDCAAYSDVKVFSYGPTGDIRSVQFEIASVLGGESPHDTCSDSNIVTQLKASCVNFTCGSSVHVSAQSRMERRQSKLCRYWSSASSIPSTVPASHDLTSFHFVDPGTHHGNSGGGGHGIYRSFSSELALMKCYSGSDKEPSNTMDPNRGAAVTFTCLS